MSRLSQLMRKRVSRKNANRRFNDGNFDLDLVYITPTIIAMGFPSAGIESTFRNPIDDVARFLDSRHPNNYMIFNLSERLYDYTRFGNQVLEFGFPDHNAPPLDLLVTICRSMDSWLSADPSNVAVVHCLAGKGRTGTVIASYLYFSGKFPSMEEALQFFGVRRSLDVTGVTVPSQRRYCLYFSNIVSRQIPITARKLVVHKLIVNSVPHFGASRGCTPYVQVFSGPHRKLVFSSAWGCPPRSYIPVDGTMIFPIDQLVEGDVLIACLHYNASTGKGKLMFQFACHTMFVNPGSMRLRKFEVDGCHRDTNNKLFDKQFYVDLTFLQPAEADAKAQRRISAGEFSIHNKLQTLDIPNEGIEMKEFTAVDFDEEEPAEIDVGPFWNEWCRTPPRPTPNPSGSHKPTSSTSALFDVEAQQGRREPGSSL